MLAAEVYGTGTFNMLANLKQVLVDGGAGLVVYC